MTYEKLIYLAVFRYTIGKRHGRIPFSSAFPAPSALLRHTPGRGKTEGRKSAELTNEASNVFPPPRRRGAKAALPPRLSPLSKGDFRRWRLPAAFLFAASVPRAASAFFACKGPAAAERDLPRESLRPFQKGLSQRAPRSPVTAPVFLSGPEQAKSPLKMRELSAANIYSRNALTAFHSAACFFMNAIVSAASFIWRTTWAGLVPP